MVVMVEVEILEQDMQIPGSYGDGTGGGSSYGADGNRVDQEVVD